MCAALFSMVWMLAQAPAPAAESALANPDGVRIVVTNPSTNTLVRGRTDMAPLAGFAQAGERPAEFDVMVVVDVSESTLYPSGTDVDGDG